MIVIVSGFIGAVLGGLKAKKRKGTGADMLQYAAGYGIAFALVGMMVAIAIDRLVV
ncbi:MAG: apolipoprotein acyltransferase [Rhodobacteraceae bacterium]|nr:apolipoprotein acyltransferase [Paracoccaceae bacterium]